MTDSPSEAALYVLHVVHRTQNGAFGCVHDIFRTWWFELITMHAIVNGGERYVGVSLAQAMVHEDRTGCYSSPLGC